MSDLKTLEDRLTRIEELVSHQDYQVQQLNDAVLRMQTDFDGVKATLQEQIEKLESRVDERALTQDPNEKPPHY
jgi:uncharacterized coiled-coil protein SlyX